MSRAVVSTWAWPSRACITARSTPASARAVPKVCRRARGASGHPGHLPVIAEDRAQPRRGQWVSSGRALRYHEQQQQQRRRRRRVRAFGQQMAGDDRGQIAVQRYPAFRAAFARDKQPPATDIDIGDSRASTSHDRSPRYNISPAIARSRVVRRLPSKAVTSSAVKARGSRLGVRSRSRERGEGRRFV